jgi:hypothetical protein
MRRIIKPMLSFSAQDADRRDKAASMVKPRPREVMRGKIGNHASINRYIINPLISRIS